MANSFYNKNVSIRKIENGYVIEAYCEGEQQAEYFKKLSKVKSILERWFGEKNKSGEELRDMKRETTEEKLGGNKPGVNVKIQMTKS